MAFARCVRGIVHCYNNTVELALFSFWFVLEIFQKYFACFTTSIMKGVIYMFNFFKKKVREEDPILKEINWQTEELKAINDSIRRNNESLEADIQKAERLLLKKGYSQEDLEKLKIKSKLKIIK